MKEISVILSCVIFFTFLAVYFEQVNADHLDPGPGIFNGEQTVELITSKNSEYKIYLQVIVRDVNGTLVHVIENTAVGAYIPHAITDHVFYNLMGEKEIITVDNKKYEKAQYVTNPSLEQRWIGLYPIYSETSFEFISDPDSDATAKMYSIDKDYSMWKMHYCATFENHGYNCVPVFQVLVPNVTLAPTDILEQQWTILREIE